MWLLYRPRALQHHRYETHNLRWWCRLEGACKRKFKHQNVLGDGILNSICFYMRMRLYIWMRALVGTPGERGSKLHRRRANSAINWPKSKIEHKVVLVINKNHNTTQCNQSVTSQLSGQICTSMRPKCGVKVGSMCRHTFRIRVSHLTSSGTKYLSHKHSMHK